MKILELESKLTYCLQSADECWIAVAMMNEYGFNTIQQNIHPDCLQHYLVGINLPTPVYVLEKLKHLGESDNINSKIFDSEKVFHPKLYIIRQDERYTAFIGSANCTQGGLKSNIELSYKIENNDTCLDLINNYFRIHYKNASEITDEFLDDYRDIFERRKTRAQEDKREMKKLLKPKKKKFDLNGIVFSNQFFKYEHFYIFEPPKPTKHWADAEREEVGKRLLDLDELLWPEIQQKRWNIHRHPEPHHRHSTTQLSVANSFGIRKLESVWLHYGKSETELKRYKDLKLENSKQTFINHIRFQVIIHYDDVGVWLVIGKTDGSLFDRDYFKRNMNDSVDYRQQFYDRVKALGDNYFISVSSSSKRVTEFTNPDKLMEFTNQDIIYDYFIIYKKFSPDSAELSENDITTTIIDHFEALYPIYELVKHTL